MPMPLPRALTLALAAAVASGALVGCAPDRETALAIQHARRLTPTVVELRTECARHVRVEVHQAPRAKPEVTIWGHPRVGRCQPVLHVRLRTDQIVDATTSMAVQVRPAG